MESFQDYLISEYKIDYAAVEFKYNHNSTVKIDKPTSKPILHNNILVGVKFYDKNLKLLESVNLKFTDNNLTKTCEKKLINIAPAELNNKFMRARNEIVKKITNELVEKREEIDNRIISLNAYIGNQNIAISKEFEGEKISFPDNTNNKKSFEM